MTDAAAHLVPVEQTPSLRRLLDLAWPIIISRSAQVVVSVSDAAMVSHLGQDSLAATTTGGLNLMAFFLLPMGVVFIVSSFASQLYGRGDHAGARRYGYYGLAVAAMAQLLYFAGALVIPRAVAAIGYTPAVATLMQQWLTVRLCTGGAAIGLEALGNYYGGLGNPRLPMATQVLCMVLNVALNWVFISGHLGAPALGVVGSALGSALATLTAFLVLLGCFLAGVGEHPSARQGKAQLRFAELVRMLRFGIPSGLNWFVEFGAFSLFINVVINGLGTTTLAGFMASMEVNQVAAMPAFGLTSAGAILVGQAIGAKNLDQVPKTVKLTALVACGWMGFVGLVYLVFARYCMLPFAPPGAEREAFLDIAAQLLTLSITWQMFDATVMTLAEALRAAGDTAFTAWVRGIVAWCVFVPGSFISVRVLGGGIGWVVFWLTGYIAIMAFVLFLRFRSGAWRKLDLAGTEIPAL
ncbi:MATE family efflux transporter [Polyangium fumosum]|nr:MATE family efflux transporter [Polyangium fumosum]